MAEGYINLFLNEHEGTNRPHYKLSFKIDGVDHEAALWPNREGKAGFSGKYKPKGESAPRQESVATGALEEVQKHFSAAKLIPKEKLPF